MLLGILIQQHHPGCYSRSLIQAKKRIILPALVFRYSLHSLSREMGRLSRNTKCGCCPLVSASPSPRSRCGLPPARARQQPVTPRPSLTCQLLTITFKFYLRNFIVKRHSGRHFPHICYGAASGSTGSI